MKKITTFGTALLSILALAACGEKDTRENHIFTVEVEVTDTNGAVQKIKKNCNQLQNICSASFDLETPFGMKGFDVNVSNKPVHQKEIMIKTYSAKNREEARKITDTEYKQRAYVSSNQFGILRFKAPSFKDVNWIPRTERKLEAELKIPNPALPGKYADIKKRHDDAYTRFRKREISSEECHLERVALKKEKDALSMPDVKAADLTIRIY